MGPNMNGVNVANLGDADNNNKIRLRNCPLISLTEIKYAGTGL